MFRCYRILLFENKAHYAEDLADVKGQQHVKRALEVAAAGAHNVLLIGPPGSGKSLLARRLPSILPDMELAEAIETSTIHSIAGLLHRDQALVVTRPYRSPHHSTSDAGLIGGGTIPGPGEVSLAHNGVLFLDELPEFRRSVLEVLRQPLEDGQVTIARASMALTFPGPFHAGGGDEPVSCGYSTDPQRECQCTAQQLQRYGGWVSGPLLDRIDLHIELPPVQYADPSFFRCRRGLGGGAGAGERRPAAPAGPFRRQRHSAQRGDGRAHHPAVLRARRRGRAPARTGDAALRPQRPRPRPHPQGGPHHRRPGRGRRHRHRSSFGGGAVPHPWTARWGEARHPRNLLRGHDSFPDMATVASAFRLKVRTRFTGGPRPYRELW